MKRKVLDWSGEKPATYSDMIEVAHRYLDEGNEDMCNKICDIIEESLKERGIHID